MSITRKDLAACANRELALRRKVYPRFIEQGKMKRAEADREIALMQAIYRILISLPNDVTDKLSAETAS